MFIARSTSTPDLCYVGGRMSRRQKMKSRMIRLGVICHLVIITTRPWLTMMWCFRCKESWGTDCGRWIWLFHYLTGMVCMGDSRCPAVLRGDNNHERRRHISHTSSRWKAVLRSWGFEFSSFYTERYLHELSRRAAASRFGWPLLNSCGKTADSDKECKISFKD